jgi:small subunit ribosomal protein S16
MGTKKKPFYRVVVADARSPVKGKFIESIGRYNPRSNPPLVEFEEDRAIQWLLRGAEPSDTVKSLLRQQGILERAQAVKQGRRAPLTTAAETEEDALAADQ